MKPLTAPLLVLVPTHNRVKYLQYSLKSLLNQSYQDFEIGVIGDGVTDETAEYVKSLADEGAPIWFYNGKKSARTGEEYRHTILSQAESTYVTYFGDDDLALPHHFELMINALQDHDFANPLPIHVLNDRELRFAPGDLENPSSVKWHIVADRNTVSLTGASHTLESYRRLPYGWRSAPPGEYTDHYMWRQYFALPHLRATTISQSTTIKLVNSTRKDLLESERVAELADWFARIQQPDFIPQWDALVARTVHKTAVMHFLMSEELRIQLAKIKLESNEVDGNETNTN